MNNFEKIKAMNIDEMVKWVSSITDCCFCPMQHPTDVKCYEGCPDGIKLWLESEVRE